MSKYCKVLTLHCTEHTIIPISHNVQLQWSLEKASHCIVTMTQWSVGVAAALLVTDEHTSKQLTFRCGQQLTNVYMCNIWYMEPLHRPVHLLSLITSQLCQHCRPAFVEPLSSPLGPISSVAQQFGVCGESGVSAGPC